MEDEVELYRWLCKYFKLTEIQCLTIMLVLAKSSRNVYQVHQDLKEAMELGDKGAGALILKLGGKIPKEPPVYASVHNWLTGPFVRYGFVSIEKQVSKKEVAIGYRDIVQPSNGISSLVQSYERSHKLQEGADTLCRAIVTDKEIPRVFLAQNPSHPIEFKKTLYQMPMRYWAKGDGKLVYQFEQQAAEAAVEEVSEGRIKWSAYHEMAGSPLKHIWANGRITVHRVWAGLVKEKNRLKPHSPFAGQWFDMDQVKTNPKIDPEARDWLSRI